MTATVMGEERGEEWKSWKGEGDDGREGTKEERVGA